MAKKNSNPGPLERIRRLIIAVVSIIVVIIAAIIGALEGDLLEEDTGTSPTSAPVQQATSAPGDVTAISFEQGYGATNDFWEVYFTAPTGESDRSTYEGGVDQVIVDALNDVQNTLDIAAFEWNNPDLTQAVIDAHERGVEIRMVVDDEHVLEDEDTTIEDVIDAGVPVVDDDRSGFMHNKFMIMDGSTVLTGSMNFTINGTFRNNNNFIILRSRRAVETYQAEFNEMFQDEEFGSSRSDVDGSEFTQDGTPVQIIFSPEDDVVPELVELLDQAQDSIRFMTFSFTLDEVGEALLEKSEEGVDVQGIFEVTGSRTEFSELPRLLCAGVEVKQDGNPFTFHHKVFIIDGTTVLTGSFNISNNATERNDENMLIIQDQDLAGQYLLEFARGWTQAADPPREEITCP